MRYQNWDVLLFPGDSRVPLQEFDTKCHSVVVEDSSQCSSDSNVSLTSYESMSHALFLTTFVPSQAPYTPFRVSIHSWYRPSASPILLNRKTLDEVVTFEARVFVDGVRQAQRLLHEGSSWPAVLESTGVTSNCMGRALQFPPFHPELLVQAHWDPAASHGRIQVTLTEGVTRPNSPSSSGFGAFDRLRPIVTFSFQHAPQSVLEQSGIAWPNTQLFTRPVKRSRQLEPISTRLLPANNADLHAHSPTKASSAIAHRIDPAYLQLVSRQASKAPLSATTLATAAPSSLRFRGSNTGDDPFTEPMNGAGSQWRPRTRMSSGQDVSMRDDSSYKTEFSHRTMDMSEVSCQQLDFVQQLNQAATEEIIKALSPAKQAEVLEALSPPKRASAGLRPPRNTPIGSEMKILRECPNTRIRRSLNLGVNSHPGNISPEEQENLVNVDDPTELVTIPERHTTAKSSKLSSLSKALGLSSLTSGSVRLSASPGKNAVFSHIDRGMETSSPASRLSLSDMIRSRSDSNTSKRKRSPSFGTRNKTSRQTTPQESPSSHWSEQPGRTGLNSENPNPSAESVALIS